MSKKDVLVEVAANKLREVILGLDPYQSDSSDKWPKQAVKDILAALAAQPAPARSTALDPLGKPQGGQHHD
jgi:hypothetical protein